MAGKRLYQNVAEDLLRIIESGQYAVGERLPAVRDLAEQYNVSRPTIREAILALEISGRVQVRKGSGVYVTAPENSSESGSLDMDIGPFELIQARLLIESEVAALAATRITESEIAELGQIIENMINENNNNFPSERADKDFHMLIAKASRNSAFVTIVEELWNWRDQSTLTHKVYETVRLTGVRPSIKEHWDIHDALKAGNSSAAREAMRLHLSRVADTMFRATEIEAVEQVKRKISADRARYSHFR